jgi:hypothetical protein
MSGTTARRGGMAGVIAAAYDVPYALVRRPKHSAPLSEKHDAEVAHFAAKSDARDVRFRRNEYNGLRHSKDGRKRLARLSSLRVQLGVAQRRRITVRHMLHGDMVNDDAS